MKSMLPSLLVGVALSAACGSPNPGDDAAAQSDAARSDTAQSDTATTDGGASMHDSSAGPDGAQPDAAQSDTGPTPDASDDGHSTTLATKQCFFFATGMATLDNPCDGDLFTLEGAMVDLASGGGSNSGMGGLCEQAGTYPDLASVPRDYSACTWGQYVEGGLGLANHGILVRGLDNVHHYRMWIQSNALPSLVFRWDMID